MQQPQPMMMQPGMVAQPGMTYQDPAMMGMQMGQPGMVAQPGMMTPAPGYDEDPRTQVPPYYVTKDFNFVDGG